MLPLHLLQQSYIAKLLPVGLLHQSKVVSFFHHLNNDEETLMAVKEWNKLPLQKDHVPLGEECIGNPNTPNEYPIPVDWERALLETCLCQKGKIAVYCQDEQKGFCLPCSDMIHNGPIETFHNHRLSNKKLSCQEKDCNATRVVFCFECGSHKLCYKHSFIVHSQENYAQHQCRVMCVAEQFAPQYVTRKSREIFSTPRPTKKKALLPRTGADPDHRQERAETSSLNDPPNVSNLPETKKPSNLSKTTEQINIDSPNLTETTEQIDIDPLNFSILPEITEQVDTDPPNVPETTEQTRTVLPEFSNLMETTCQAHTAPSNLPETTEQNHTVLPNLSKLMETTCQTHTAPLNLPETTEQTDTDPLHSTKFGETIDPSFLSQQRTQEHLSQKRTQEHLLPTEVTYKTKLVNATIQEKRIPNSPRIPLKTTSQESRRNEEEISQTTILSSQPKTIGGPDLPVTKEKERDPDRKKKIRRGPKSKINKLRKTLLPSDSDLSELSERELSGLSDSDQEIPLSQETKKTVNTPQKTPKRVSPSKNNKNTITNKAERTLRIELPRNEYVVNAEASGNELLQHRYTSLTHLLQNSTTNHVEMSVAVQEISNIIVEILLQGRYLNPKTNLIAMAGDVSYQKATFFKCEIAVNRVYRIPDEQKAPFVPTWIGRLAAQACNILGCAYFTDRVAKENPFGIMFIGPSLLCHVASHLVSYCVNKAFDFLLAGETYAHGNRQFLNGASGSIMVAIYLEVRKQLKSFKVTSDITLESHSIADILTFYAVSVAEEKVMDTQVKMLSEFGAWAKKNMDNGFTKPYIDGVNAWVHSDQTSEDLKNSLKGSDFEHLDKKEYAFIHNFQ